jgi:hypothetical protein
MEILDEVHKSKSIESERFWDPEQMPWNGQINTVKSVFIDYSLFLIG